MVVLSHICLRCLIRGWKCSLWHAIVPHYAWDSSQQIAAAASSQAKQEGETRMNYLYTKRINDPSLIPALLASGVQFGAVKVNTFYMYSIHSHHDKFLKRLITQNAIICSGI